MIELRSDVLAVSVVPHGARLARLVAPDRDGRPGEVVAGLTEDGYRDDRAYLGATVGRFANRIAGGTFTLDGRVHRLPCNEDGATLHGGAAGLDHAPFVAGPVESGPGGQSVTLRHTSPDGAGGFPGTLDVTVTYAVSGADLAITLTAATDAPTVVNLTNHAYFDLRGASGGRPGGIGDHEITVHADTYLPVDARLIPEGGPMPVAGTRFDLTRPTRIGAGGYDHCFVLHGRGPQVRGLPVAAHVREAVSGRTLTVATDQPGLQFYSGTMLDGSITTRDGRVLSRGDALCLEPQHFPDSPNRPDFPSTVLRPGGQHRTRILLRLGTDPSER